MDQYYAIEWVCGMTWSFGLVVKVDKDKAIMQLHLRVKMSWASHTAVLFFSLFNFPQIVCELVIGLLYNDLIYF